MSTRNSAPGKRRASPAPPTPDIRVAATEKPIKDIWLFVEESREAGTWIEIDRQHVFSQEDTA